AHWHAPTKSREMKRAESNASFQVSRRRESETSSQWKPEMLPLGGDGAGINHYSAKGVNLNERKQRRKSYVQEDSTEMFRIDAFRAGGDPAVSGWSGAGADVDPGEPRQWLWTNPQCSRRVRSHW